MSDLPSITHQICTFDVLYILGAVNLAKGSGIFVTPMAELLTSMSFQPEMSQQVCIDTDIQLAHSVIASTEYDCLAEMVELRSALTCEWSQLSVMHCLTIKL